MSRNWTIVYCVAALAAMVLFGLTADKASTLHEHPSGHLICWALIAIICATFVPVFAWMVRIESVDWMGRISIFGSLAWIAAVSVRLIQDGDPTNPLSLAPYILAAMMPVVIVACGLQFRRGQIYE
jgi:hypothetical protein